MTDTNDEPREKAALEAANKALDKGLGHREAAAEYLREVCGEPPREPCTHEWHHYGYDDHQSVDRCAICFEIRYSGHVHADEPRSLRELLLYYQGTTDPELLAEIWEARAKANDEVRGASIPYATHLAAKREWGNKRVLILDSPELHAVFAQVLAEVARQDAGTAEYGKPSVSVMWAAFYIREALRLSEEGAENG